MSQFSVYPYTQRTIALCWEACGRMMWHFRHGGLGGYQARAGHYLSLTTGLNEPQMDGFYRQLGMRSLPAPHVRNIERALHWSPVIFSIVGQETGHALVASGTSGSDTLIVMNPCAQMVVSFDEGGGGDSCTAGPGTLPLGAVARNLGQFVWYW